MFNPRFIRHSIENARFTRNSNTTNATNQDNSGVSFANAPNGTANNTAALDDGNVVGSDERMGGMRTNRKRFRGVWLQMYEYYHNIGHDEPSAPGVFQQLRETRKLNRGCMLVSLDLVDKVDPQKLVSAVRDSKRDEADIKKSEQEAAERAARSGKKADGSSAADEDDDLTLFHKEQDAE